MSQAELVSPHRIRARFAAAMTQMYRAEVPAFGALEDMVRVHNESMDSGEICPLFLSPASDETRHGAIRVGSADELQVLRRIFAVMGMQPVGYYDLSVASLPVHSTAFRATDRANLSISPFRIFTSLLRVELIQDQSLRAIIVDVLAKRKIVSDHAVELLEEAETLSGLTQEKAERFVDAVLETFKWHGTSDQSLELYERLASQNKLVADIVAFKGPHINHLTPASHDIDEAHGKIGECGAEPKATIEGPPARHCPILLRQTAFKAISEQVHFEGDDKHGTHTARFGEIEARGAALTRRGRAVYDDMLDEAQNAEHGDYQETLKRAFAEFPDNWDELRRKGLAYFDYALTEKGQEAARTGGREASIDQLIKEGFVVASPIVYEDFLPVSAAGIFRSNLGDDDNWMEESSSNQTAFEAALGTAVLDPFQLYEEQSQDSLQNCLTLLKASG